MKIQILILTFAISLSFLACQSEDSKVIDPNIDSWKLSEEARMSPEHDFPGKIPTDIGFNRIAHDPDNYTWKDSDDYYRNELPKYADELFYGNLKSFVLYVLVNLHEMDKKADANTVQYYLKEMFTMDYFPDPEVYVRLLERLQSEGFSAEQLAPYAIGKYNAIMEHFKTEWDDPERIIKKYDYKYQSLKDFERSIKEELNK